MPFVTIVKFALAPVLILQGRRVRKTALRLPEAEGDREGQILHPQCRQPLNLLFIGDSTMAGVGASHQQSALGASTAREVSSLLCRSVRWKVIAQSGMKTSQILSLTAAAQRLHADVLITALGANDVTAQTSPRKFIEAYENLIAAVLPTNHSRIAIISGLPPLHITPAIPQPLRWFFGLYAHKLDRTLRRWSRGAHGVSYLSLQWAAGPTRLAPDGFHPGEDLYQEWAHRIAQQIVRGLAVQLPSRA